MMLTTVGASFSFDPASRLRLRIFTFKLAVVVPVSVALAFHRNYPLLGTISFLCYWHSVFAGIARPHSAIARRCLCDGMELNGSLSWARSVDA